MSPVLEICAGSMQSALAALAGGANRIELCDNMAEGGTTPSYGMISTCKKLLNIPVFPIIRPRGGDFVYSVEEFEVMKRDVINCSELGCEGVVFGILRKDGSIDMERCSELIALAKTMQVTFHRAFDQCNDLEKGLEDLITIGCDRVLTSGGKMYAAEGIMILKDLVEQAENRLIIMPGSGITHKNISKLIRGTGAFEFHSTAKKLINVSSHTADLPTYLYETDTAEVAKMKQIIITHLMNPSHRMG